MTTVCFLKIESEDRWHTIGARQSQMLRESVPARVETSAVSIDNRDRGEPDSSAPPTPPDIRVRIRRFGGLCGLRCRDGSQAECTEERDWHGDGERGAVCEPPRAMWATGGLCRQIPADAATSQLGKASVTPIPLFPGD